MINNLPSRYSIVPHAEKLLKVLTEEPKPVGEIMRLSGVSKTLALQGLVYLCKIKAAEEKNGFDSRKGRVISHYKRA